MKKVLIVSYTFPPYPGVGGRRWAKFGKVLNKNGYDLKVISFRSSDLKVKSNWTSDISSYEEQIEYFSSHYPKWLRTPTNFAEKVLYRLCLLYVKVFARGNYYDRASFLRKSITKQVLKKIRAGYDNIIVSCAPFKLALWVSEIKVTHPKVNLIVDFRDRWTNNSVAYGFESLSDKRKKFEIDAEKKVIDRADVVITVAPEMTNYLRKRSANPSTRFLTIGNGFDPDDFAHTPSSTVSGRDVRKLRLIFAGTLYNKTIHHFLELNQSLIYLMETSPTIYQNICMEFFGSYGKEVERLLAGHENIQFLGQIPNKEIYGRIQASDACMTFLPDEGSYALNTKFFEYLAQKKSIVIFSKKGTASEFISKNRLGYAIEPGTVTSSLLRIYNDFCENALVCNPDFDLSAHDVTKLASQVESLLR